MKAKPFLIVILAALVLVLVIPSLAPAEVVGKLTKVEGRVDILKGGKLPATPVKVGDSVESGDVIRCKSLSRAQITFMDASIVTLSPRSRLAIKDYQFEPAQHKRNAVLRLFQGLAHVVVNKLYKVKEPDFIIRTATAVTGVRGTDFGVRLAPDSTTILNFEGKVRVASNFPEVGAALQKAAKIAFGLGGAISTLFPPGHFVDLGNMQGTEVRFNLPPTLPFAITSQDRKLFMDQLIGNFINRRSSSGPAGGAVAGTVSGTGGGNGNGNGLTVTTSESSSSVPAIAPTGLVSGTGNAAVTMVNAVTIPPVPTNNPSPTPTPTPTPSTFTFTQQYYGAWVQAAADPYSQANVQTYSWGQRTGVYDGYFSAATSATRTAGSGVSFSPLTTGTASGSATGTVTGTLGQTLTGTMTVTGTNSLGSNVTRTGTVTLQPTGELTYNWTDTTSRGATTTTTGAGTTTQTPGTHFSQSVSGKYTSTPNLAGNQEVVTNQGTLGGTQTMAGKNTWVDAGFSVTNTSPNAKEYTPESGRITIDSQGVLSAPDSSGKQTGVMTSTVTTTSSTSTDTNTIGGPVTAVPDTGSTPPAMVGEVIGANKDPNQTTVGAYAQTSSTSTQIVTQTHQGSYNITPTSGTTGTIDSTGWGASNTAAAGSSTSTTTNTVSNLTGTVTDPTGPSTKPGIINTNVAAVVCASSPCSHQGPAQLVGVADNHAVVSATGTANTATGTVNNLNGNFVSPDSKGTLTNGTMTVTSGTPVTITPASTGSTTVNLNPGPAGNQQTATLNGTVVNKGTLQTLTGGITSTTDNPSNFPPSGTFPANVNVQGVVNASGKGAVTVTVNPTNTGPSSSPVSTYAGKVANVSSTVTAAVVGQNPANPGVNHAPATQAGSVQTH
jgi:hypothetical protein